jgi:hypothetical protein
MDNRHEPIEELIERSSLGTRDARRRRARVPASAVAGVLAQARARGGQAAPRTLPTERSIQQAQAKVPNAVTDRPPVPPVTNRNGGRIPKKVSSPEPALARRRALVALTLALGLVVPGAASLVTVASLSSSSPTPAVTNLLLDRSAPHVPGNATTWTWDDHAKLDHSVWLSVDLLVATVASERGDLALWGVSDSRPTRAVFVVSFATSRNAVDTASRQADARARIRSMWASLPTTRSSNLLAALGAIGEHLHQRRPDGPQRLVVVSDWLPVPPHPAPPDTASREDVGNPANVAQYGEDPGSNGPDWNQQAIRRLVAGLKTHQQLPNLAGVDTWVVAVGDDGDDQYQAMEVWLAVLNAAGATTRFTGVRLPPLRQ